MTTKDIRLSDNSQSPKDKFFLSLLMRGYLSVPNSEMESRIVAIQGQWDNGTLVFDGLHPSAGKLKNFHKRAVDGDSCTTIQRVCYPDLCMERRSNLTAQQLSYCF